MSKKSKKSPESPTPSVLSPMQLKAPEIRMIPLANIVRDNGNHRLKGPENESKLRELQESMRNGLEQPILVFEQEDGPFLLGFGFRRCAAAELNGWVTIPAVVKQVPRLPDGTIDAAEIERIRAVENLDRQNLNPMEEAVAVSQLVDALKAEREEEHIAVGGPDPYKISLHLAAEKLGRPAAWVRDRCYLSRLGPKVREKVIDGSLRLNFAREIAKLGDYDDQEYLASCCLVTDDGRSWSDLNSIKRMVEQRLRSLKIVAWPLEAAEWPKNKHIVGACVGCPFNTATDKLLFEHDDKAPDDGICLKGDCFEAKQAECRKAIAKGVEKIVNKKLAATPKTAEEIGPAFVKPASLARGAKKQIDGPKQSTSKAGGGDRAKSYPELVREAEREFQNAERKYTEECWKKIIDAAHASATRKLGLILLNFIDLPWNVTEKQIKKLAPVIDGLISEDLNQILHFVDGIPDDHIDAYHEGVSNFPIAQQIAARWKISFDPAPVLADFMPPKPKDEAAAGKRKKSRKQIAREQDDSGDGDDVEDLDDE